jgi:hypothetical protein
MGIVLHQVPQDRPRPDRNHRLRDIIRAATEPHAGSAAEKDGFHDPGVFPPKSVDCNLWNRQDKSAVQIPNVGELLQDFVIQIPRKNDDIIWLRLPHSFGMMNRDVVARQERALLSL